MQRIEQRPSKRRRRNFEFVVFHRLDTIGKTQCRGTEKVNMQIPGTTKLRVLKVVMLEIGNRVTHILFSGEKRLFPDRFPSTAYPADSLQRLWNCTEAKLGTETAVSEFRVGEPQIILPLRDVI